MSLSDRDRKILIVLGPLVLILAYWFLLFSPKREEAATAKAERDTQVERRDAARQRVALLDAAKADFAADYAELVRLGKAVPTAVDMPSLIVQLESAAQGTDISFTKINAGERVAAAEATPAAPPPAAPGTGDGSQPAAAGGAPAQSTPGGQAEQAGEGVTAANGATATSSAPSTDGGGLPVGGGAAPAPGDPAAVDPATGAPATGTAATGLESVPLTLEFKGDFFDLADFFHRLKRFVDVTGDGKVGVKGRLVTVDGFDFSSDPDAFPRLTVEVRATAYLSPAAQGTTAGATPAGPTPAAPAAPVDAAAPPAAPPAATATPPAP